MRFLLHHKASGLIVPLIWAALALASWSWNASQTRAAIHDIMASQGREIFLIMEAARLWNAQHGGLYGLRNLASPSNRYLDARERDIDTPGGKSLTMINPAYMTRQMSEVILDQTGVRIHITSLKPINPNNRADAWEALALQRFEQGREEHFEVATESGRATARFMRPLLTKQACLACHAHQGYGVGDVRGGISVTFDARPYIDRIETRNTDLAVIHFAVWLLLSSLTLAGLRVIRRQFAQLTEAKDQQDHLVTLRTQELHKEMRERKEAESFLRMLVDSSGEAMFGVDREGHCNFINPAALRLLGYDSAETVLGVSLLALVQTRDSTERRDSYRACRSLEQGEYIHESDAWFVRADGGEFPVEYRSHPIFADGQVAGAVITFADISNRKAQQDALWFRANHDILTGLPNRSLFEDRLANAIAQAHRQGNATALLFVDLDHFKDANDRLGHDAGDTILREVARRMTACVRETDTVARLGGDEFVVLMPMPITREDAEQTAHRLVEQLSLPYCAGGGDAVLSASIGIALSPEDGDNANEIVRHADAAMYRAKQAGRATWRSWSGPQ